MRTAAAVLAEVRQPTGTCTYRLWVPEAVASDQTAAHQAWGDAIIGFGFEAVKVPEIRFVLTPEGPSWWVIGQVRPARATATVA